MTFQFLFFFSLSRSRSFSFLSRSSLSFLARSSLTLCALDPLKLGDSLPLVFRAVTVPEGSLLDVGLFFGDSLFAE